MTIRVHSFFLIMLSPPYCAMHEGKEAKFGFNMINLGSRGDICFSQKQSLGFQNDPKSTCNFK
jgi:hypothetical protein